MAEQVKDDVDCRIGNQASDQINGQTDLIDGQTVEGEISGEIEELFEEWQKKDFYIDPSTIKPAPGNICQICTIMFMR